ncbi:hypothetical protein ADK55_30945 [Streptomyces sp. WM4235]|uniref:hypothetical protein n=1 Tax=Streptomyces sp. WM4235 TaxID=1415551 RepID=UPI0006AEA32E|nr:hypothetical protein [Streptomyces sp. WM4235]KOU40843.1 hypothetical protein ADK55_30945 [Streptomyces sp. WM4235]
MLLNWIAEVADEPLALEPDDRRVECETNTWSLTVGDEERGSLCVSEVVGAFERAASVIRGRVRELGFPGVVTFHVWRDEQAGQLRCSTASLPSDALPFRSAYVACDDLAPLVEGFLNDNGPSLLAWSDLGDVSNLSEQIEIEEEAEIEAEAGSGIVPFPVWVRSVGA